jgi:membrane-bound transcription factor site-1 protease
MHTAVSEIDVPFRIPLIATPPRSHRILFDQFHSLRYPSGFFPRDNLDITNDLLDWNGDHLHTNFRAFFVAMRQHGFFVDVLGNDYSCVNAALYSTLVIADPEDEFAEFERQKFRTDVVQLGLSVLVLADWYSVPMIKSLRFFDENTHSWWTPVTGGSNLPALNELLEPFGIAFGARIFKGQVSLGKHTTFVASGSSIIRFPANGTLVNANVVEVLPGKKTRSRSQRAPLLGWAHVASSRIAVFSDSNCIDSSHMVISCVGPLSFFVEFKFCIQQILKCDWYPSRYDCLAAALYQSRDHQSS